MVPTIYSWLRTLFFLRHPEVRKCLGEIRLKQIILTEIQGHYPDCRLSEGIELISYKPDRLRLGQRISICHGNILAFGDEGNGFGVIKIGSDSWVGQYNNLRASGDGDIEIGANCLISQFCTLVGSNHSIKKDRLIMAQGADKNRLGVTLGDDIWLGAGVTVMPGVAIETGAVVGASSVVLESIPAYEIWAGSPARKIGERK